MFAVRLRKSLRYFGLCLKRDKDSIQRLLWEEHNKHEQDKRDLKELAEWVHACCLYDTGSRIDELVKRVLKK